MTRFWSFFNIQTIFTPENTTYNIESNFKVDKMDWSILIMNNSAKFE